MDEYDAFTEQLRQLIHGERIHRASELARQYWSEPYTGTFFHVLADDAHPYEITARDITAVSTLNVTIPAPVAIWLLRDDGSAAVTELLHDIPLEVDIWEAGEMLARDRPLWTLWDLLATGCWPTPKHGNGMGRTKISKLLAVKRPQLVPIYDSVLETLLPAVANYWTAFKRALSDEELRLHLSIAANSGAPEGPTLLRKLDAMLWMIGKQPAW